MSRKVKYYIKIGVLILVIALAAGALISGISILTRKPNEENLIYKLYSSDASYADKSGADGSGVEWKIKKDGTVIADGEASTNTSFEIGTISLDAGTYTFTANEDVDRNKFYVVGLVNGEEVWLSDIVNSTIGKTHTFTSKTSVTFRIVVLEGAKLNNVKFTPCVVSGKIEGEYYK